MSEYNSVETAEKCMVCLSEIEGDKGIIDCVHKFCFDCIKNWRGDKQIQSCPICKHPFSSILHLDVNNNKVTINHPTLIIFHREPDELMFYRMRSRGRLREVFESNSPIHPEHSLRHVIVLLVQCCTLGCFILIVAMVKKILFRN